MGAGCCNFKYQRRREGNENIVIVQRPEEGEGISQARWKSWEFSRQGTASSKTLKEENVWGIQ